MAETTSSEQSFVTGRDVAALHDPRPTCLIGARTDKGEVCFATVIWVTPLSHNPAMIAFALRATSRTMEIIRDTGCFSICIPYADKEGIDLIEFCGNNTGHLIDKGQIVSHELVPVYDSNTDIDETGNSVLGNGDDNMIDINGSGLTNSCSSYTIDGDNGANSSDGMISNSATGSGANDNTGDPETGMNASDGIVAMVPIVKHAYSWEVGVIDSIREAGDHLLAIGTITRASTCATRDECAQLIPVDSLLCVQHGTYAKAQVISLNE